MIARSVSHLTDSAVLGKVRELVARGNATTAELLVYLSEADERRLYAPAGYSSLFAYCVAELNLSEDATCDRIDAARLVREFPALLDAVAEGLLHLSGLLMLRKYLTAVNADELISAAARRSKSQIAKMLADRFPQPDVPTWIRPLATPAPVNVLTHEPAPVRVEGPVTSVPEPGGAPVLSVPERIAVPEPRARVAPLAPERYALLVTVSKETHDKLRRAQALLGHQVPSGNVAEVLDRALAALIAQLEKQKFAATDRPRASKTAAPKTRHIPADVKRRVHERDGEQCTFVGTNGRRCQEFRRLEFDHVVPVARGGMATFENIRLRCRAHNQYDAERAFGTELMRSKRQARTSKRAVSVGSDCGRPACP